jgi:DNA-binding response OmpR family regulator
LDLNIPKISGYTVLALYPPKKKTPVAVFSASDNEADIDRAFSLGAREFVHKPMDLDDYKTTVSGMVQKCLPSE